MTEWLAVVGGAAWRHIGRQASRWAKSVALQGIENDPMVATIKRC